MNELNKERRKIADYLRALASHSAADEELVQDTLGLYRGNNIEGYDTYGVKHLADLIDRPTCHDVTDLDRESFKCSRCGYRVLSIDGAPDAAKLVSPKGGVVDFGYCPNCGAEVVE